MHQKNQLAKFGIFNQILFATGSLSFNMMERMMILYVAFFYLPPAEHGLDILIPDKPFWGFMTTLGAIMLIGRFFDAVADPLVAQISDNSRSKIGRRKLYMLIGGLPLCLSAALLFYPPDMGHSSLANSLWMGLMISIFYFAFTAYVNPFLALLPELGQTESIRINISTFMAFFGLIGMVLVMVVFPLAVGRFEDAGLGIRESYQRSTLLFAPLALIVAYLVTLSFKESKHCLPSSPSGIKVWDSLKQTYSIKHFRIYLYGELCVYFCVNIITMGMVYYAVVLFRGGEKLGIEAFQGDQFMMVVAGAALLVAILSFPVVNLLAKKIGKKKVLYSSMAIMMIVTFLLFLFSGNMHGSMFYMGLFLFALAGIPLASLTTLLFSTLSDIAREDAMRTGNKREGMFYAARAIPLKFITALSGVCFGYLLSLGRDISNPLGIQLSLLSISIVSVFGVYFFLKYPERDVLSSLKIHEEKVFKE